MVGRYPNPSIPANRPNYPPVSNSVLPSQPSSHLSSQPQPYQPQTQPPATTSYPPNQRPPVPQPTPPPSAPAPAHASHAPVYQLPSKWGRNPSLSPVGATPPVPQQSSAPTRPTYPPMNMQPQASAPTHVPATQAAAIPPSTSTSAAPQTFQHNRPLPQRPLPAGTTPDITATANGLHNLSMQPSGPYHAPTMQAASTPPGMLPVDLSEASSLPRPDLTGLSTAVRIASGDPPQAVPETPGYPSVPGGLDPAACPAEIFVPASSRCVRLTNTAFPQTRALASKYALPLGAVIQPLAAPGPNEEPVPVVNFGTSGIVRCRRCRSYINFACTFRDGGHRWICNMCTLSNDCPSDYFASLDQSGKRTDAAERPELHRGSVEFVAPAEYMVRPPMPPVYLFLLETTPATIDSGVLAAGIAGIRNSIDSMPNEGRTRVAIITFDSAIQFYSLRAGPDAEPSVYVVSDIEDVFLPTPNEILAQLTDCRPSFEKALTLIGSTYASSNGMVSAASCLGAALQAAHKAMELIGGKLVVIASSRPTAGPGALRERGDNAILGTDRERAILRPDSSFYSQLAVTMSKCQIGCDLFLCPPPPARYLDLSSLSQVSKFTGGELFYCANFEAAKDAPRLQLAVNRTLARESGLEAVMRIRATKSVRCSKFSGRFFVRSTDLLAMPNVDADKAYSVRFDFDDVSLGDGPFCLQVALLFTTTSGERRIRVHTVAVPVANSLADLFTRVDTPATGNILTRMTAEAMKDRGMDELRKSMSEKVISALCKYREVCLTQYSSHGVSGQFLTTEAMKLLPLFMHGLLRSAILCRDVCGAFLYKFDDKVALSHDVDVMNVAETSAFAYPNILPVYPWRSHGDRAVKHPDACTATLSSLRRDCGVLIDDGRSMTLWLGEDVIQRFVTELLGNVSNGQIDPRFLGVELMRRGGTSKGMIGNVFAAVKSIVGSRRPSIAVQVVPQGDRMMQARIEAMMVEERTAATMNYRDFMLEVQRRTVSSSARK